MTHTSTEQPTEALSAWARRVAKEQKNDSMDAYLALTSCADRLDELEAIRKAACKAYNAWAYADDTFGEVTQAMHALADAINGITQEKQG